MKPKSLFVSFIFMLVVALSLTSPAQPQVSYGLSGGDEGTKFPVESLTVDKDTQFKTPTVIKIEGYENGFLVATKGTAVPTHMAMEGGNLDFKFLTQGVNVIWEFVKPGIRFETKEGVYISEKAGATIRFTKGGVQMKGIKKMQK
jgi:hypothetical protein